MQHTPPDLDTICTAVVPDAVLTLRKRAHTSTPYGHLVPHHQALNAAIPTKTRVES